MVNPSEAAPLLEMFVIYENPADWPSKFVLRRWVSRPDGSYAPDAHAWVTSTLEEARAKLPRPDLHCLGRLPDDDRAIAETWI